MVGLTAYLPTLYIIYFGCGGSEGSGVKIVHPFFIIKLLWAPLRVVGVMVYNDFFNVSFMHKYK